MTLEALLEAGSADAVPVHAQVDRRLHVFVALGTCEVLDQALVVIRF